MSYCDWGATDELHRAYHDAEWGVPVHDDRAMFEHLTLECLQCGLSWGLMLKKRAIFRECFDQFDFDKIAGYGADAVARILATDGMIRSRRKIEAVVNHARRAQETRDAFGSLCEYFWRFSDGKTILYSGHESGAIPVSNGLSARIAADMKKRGFLYVGAITIYSHLQACGIVCDHDQTCPCRARIVESHPTVVKRRDHEKP